METWKNNIYKCLWKEKIDLIILWGIVVEINIFRINEEEAN